MRLGQPFAIFTSTVSTLQLLPPAFHLRTLLAVQPSSGPLLLLAGNVAIRSMKVTEKGHILRRQERWQESCLAIHRPQQLIKIGVEGLNGSKQLAKRCLFLGWLTKIQAMIWRNKSPYDMAPCEIANGWITMDNKHAHHLPISVSQPPSSMGIDGKLAGMRDPWAENWNRSWFGGIAIQIYQDFEERNLTWVTCPDRHTKKKNKTSNTKPTTLEVVQCMRPKPDPAWVCGMGTPISQICRPFQQNQGWWPSPAPVFFEKSRAPGCQPRPSSYPTKWIKLGSITKYSQIREMFGNMYFLGKLSA